MSILKVEKYRPKFHFSPAAEWMNDPNGLVYFNEEYHLFYQHHPYGMEMGAMHWGHAVSRDLMTWEHLPVALAPDENGMIFSGSAVVDWNDTTGFFGGKPGLVAIFTHHNGLTLNQTQSIAYSHDSGRTWIKYEGNPVISSDKYDDFRDPKVFWHEETKRWVMVLACGQTVCFYHSTNLKEWTFSSEFGKGIGSHDGVWECPDLFALPVDGDKTKLKWVFLVSIGNEPDIKEGSRTQYFTGHFDGRTFMPDEASQTIRWLDYGRDNYAGVSWSDIPEEDGRRIYIGWMSNWRYASTTPTKSWRGAMTIPRELTLESRNGEAALIQRPVLELEKFRTPLLEVEGEAVNELNLLLKDQQLVTYEIVAEFEPVQGIDSFGFKLRTSQQEETVAGYSVKESAVFVDRTRSGVVDFHEHFPGKHQAVLPPDLQYLQLRLIVDRSSVELFAGDGLVAITDLIYPSPSSLGLSFFCNGKNEIPYKVKMYKL
ncbi:glycoside hydrolase family 32 protein [Paenibacillus sp. sptzw28]|uniref:glycoside hydrolase family 32 protein n=1 Tax=Paenibacillus sp. sptzw28 TaxID=715179 RepID=UPI001C6E1F49|nr:glycoside hydrolase family 32 protein [Paenibacillus sp. sptzw28]QYR22244.1 glycoside hydrolase family 32 protein [Paenibacillus sp. sptzw28]